MPASLLAQTLLGAPLALVCEIVRYDRAPKLDAAAVRSRFFGLRARAQKLDQIPDLVVAQPGREPGHRRSRDAVPDPPEQVSGTVMSRVLDQVGRLDRQRSRGRTIA